MKLYRIILPVKNIDEAENFYSLLFKIPGSRVSPGRHYFNLEGTILACYDAKADGDDDNPIWKAHFNQYVYIAVDNLKEVYETLVKLDTKKIDSNIEEMPWGERLFYAKDPSDNPICFVDRATVFTGD